MFSTIFTHELKYWFKKPAFYIYAAILFIISIFFSAASAGIFDSITVSVGGNKIVNSPMGIYGMFNGMSQLIFFLLPSIIGVTIFRDYKSEMHSILYSYPFTKASYLFAKFLSGLIIVTLLVFVIGLAVMIGFRLPGTNSEIVGAFNFGSYLHSYLVYIIPNLILFGAIVFAVVTFTRNIAAGFITVIALMFIQGLTQGLLSEEENRFLAGLIDPYGNASLQYYTRYWTLAEQNDLSLPFKGLIIYNRLLWLGVAGVVFGLVYKYFSFSQSAISLSFFKKEKGERVTKKNFGGITRVQLPKVNYNFSFVENLKAAWKLAKVDFKYIVKALPFIAIVLVGLILALITLSEVGNILGTKTLPVTWKTLQSATGAFVLPINLITFLYAGMLVHRGKMAKANHLVDVTPTPNWVLWLSKLIALLKVQLILLAVVMLSGVIYQTYKGFYNFEITHYMYELFVLQFLHFAIWALMALFIQTLVGNAYLGLFILLVLNIGLPLLTLAGVEQSIFKYNQGPSFRYSDMNGYGSSLRSYLIYKTYWLLGGLILLVFTSLFWVRGIPHSFKERLSIFKERFNVKTGGVIAVLLIGFLGIGGNLYYENNIKNKRTSRKEREEQRVQWEKDYKKYEGKAQPRIVAVNVDVNIFPKKLDFNASGTYKMINKTNEAIDSLFLDHNSYPSTFEFNKPVTLVHEDTIQNFDIYQLEKSLQPGDSLELNFTVKNKENTFFRKNSPVRYNGTFINNFQLFPRFGYQDGSELTDNKTRKKYGLPKNDLKPHPSDSTALGNTYISKDADWIDFEATVSTSEDQIAIAPGYLQKEWIKDGRRYFHYKMDSKILNFYAFNSAKYQVKKDKWNDVNLEIYYQKGHEYNLDRMMKGIKASLDYNSKNFSPYQHKQVRIIEFPKTGGSFAQSFPNTIPYSESVGFIAEVNKEDTGVDYPFAITVHELAHQWFAHQVIGADVLGATMMSESMSEYVSLKVLEHAEGKSEMRKFLKKALDGYLTQRTFERKREKPLMYNDGQGYIHYQKGSLVFYALSDYIGEEKLNNALKEYVEKVKFQNAPYTTSIEMVDKIREVTPDSLQYVIKDMFETITLYRNRITKVDSKKLDNGKYQVDIEFDVSKYRNDDKGKRFYGEKVGDTISYKTEKMKKPILSVPLADYIDIGIFGETEVDGKKKEKELYLKKHKITQIHNKISIIVDEKPIEVGVDPYNKLIDTQSDDNRRKL
ncbi:membrane protein [Tenacibaculum holothuriorum]|uniref:Membrane protein n=1 Tax=Tenacibaculum holothuriorum TaxID=1635173 RepID=A0A1Y2PAU6_9FLAO|nr:M1 family aminopeptidase [Tenacibaculum holothuriorum]OSY87280.1 membrane protein [Tenacibaculum holothuriorum]